MKIKDNKISNPAKKVGLFLLIAFIMGSCFCYKGPVSEYGQIRKDVKTKNYVIDESLYNIIDTTVIYQEYGSIVQNEYHKKDDYMQGNSYLKFHANGKVSSFVGIGYNRETFSFNPEHKLSISDFNPAKSRMGYFYKKEDKIISEFFLQHPDCHLYLLKSEIKIENDTLVLKHIKPPFKNQKDIYIKKSIPIEFLKDWHPDW